METAKSLFTQWQRGMLIWRELSHAAFRLDVAIIVVYVTVALSLEQSAVSSRVLVESESYWIHVWGENLLRKTHANRPLFDDRLPPRVCRAVLPTAADNARFTCLSALLMFWWAGRPRRRLVTCCMAGILSLNLYISARARFRLLACTSEASTALGETFFPNTRLAMCTSIPFLAPLFLVVLMAVRCADIHMGTFHDIADGVNIAGAASGQ